MERPPASGRDAEQIAAEIARIRAQLKRFRNQEQITKANLREIEELSARETELSRQLVDAMVERVTTTLAASSTKQSKKATSPRQVSSTHKSPTKPTSTTVAQKKPATQLVEIKLDNAAKVLRLHFAEHPVAQQLLTKPSRLRPFATFIRLGLCLKKFTDFSVIRNELKKNPWLLTELGHLLDSLNHGSPITEHNVRQICKQRTALPQWKGEQDPKAFEKDFCSEFPLSPPERDPRAVEKEYCSDFPLSPPEPLPLYFALPEGYESLASSQGDSQ